MKITFETDGSKDNGRMVSLDDVLAMLIASVIPAAVSSIIYSICSLPRADKSFSLISAVYFLRKNDLIDIYDKMGFSYLDQTMDDQDTELEAYRQTERG